MKRIYKFGWDYKEVNTLGENKQGLCVCGGNRQATQNNEKKREEKSGAKHIFADKNHRERKKDDSVIYRFILHLLCSFTRRGRSGLRPKLNIKINKKNGGKLIKLTLRLFSRRFSVSFVTLLKVATVRQSLRLSLIGKSTGGGVALQIPEQKKRLYI